MHCKKCGTELPKNAEYCFNCGTKVDGVIETTSRTDVIQLNKKTVMIAGAIIAALLIVLLIAVSGGKGNSTSPATNNSVQEIDTNKPDKYQITLTGKYVVGEDEELPPGIYEITNVQGENLFGVRVIFDKGEDDYDRLWTNRVTGYKLKSGYIVEINEDGAVFTKLADINETPKESKESDETTEVTSENNED